MNSLVNEKLNETRENLIEEISALKNNLFNAKPDREKWSIAQVCHHLALVELATIKAIHWGLRQKENQDNDRKNLHSILDRTKKIQAPKIVDPSEEPFEVKQMIHLLNESRQKLLKTILSIEDPSVLKKKSVDHPAFGALPLDQWIEFVPLHEKRHIKQIEEIKSSFHN